MLTFFKINSQECLDWNDEPGDSSTFIVIVKIVAHENGFSTYVLCNHRSQNKITQRHSTAGHHTIKVISQFDVALETSITHFSGDMPVIGFNALKAFLVSTKQPLWHSGLKQVLDGNREFQEELGQVSPNV